MIKSSAVRDLSQHGAWRQDRSASRHHRGLHPIEASWKTLMILTGFASTGLTHFFDNEVGGSAHSLEKAAPYPTGPSGDQASGSEIHAD
jgi:microsomal dipeptidase-like Zn-dependent dipeptidase